MLTLNTWCAFRISHCFWIPFASFVCSPSSLARRTTAPPPSINNRRGAKINQKIIKNKEKWKSWHPKSSKRPNYVCSHSLKCHASQHPSTGRGRRSRTPRRGRWIIPQQAKTRSNRLLLFVLGYAKIFSFLLQMGPRIKELLGICPSSLLVDWRWWFYR